MSKRLKIIIFALSALIILLLILQQQGLIGSDNSVKVTTEKIQKRTIVETVTASGKIYPESEVKVSADISGEITDLSVREGEKVKKGQVLAKIRSKNAMLSVTSSVTSPMDGIVTLLNVKKGERVAGSSMMAGTEMMRVADLSKIEVRVDVGENDIPKVSVGDSAIVNVEAYSNKKFKGVVTQIASSNSGNATLTSVAGSDISNYKVSIHLLPESYASLKDSTKPDNLPFRPGMSASADIKTKTHVNRLAVPINAVTTRDKNNRGSMKKDRDENGDPVTFSDELEEVVFVLQKNNTVKEMKVKTDIQDINYIEVISGLQEGEEVVTAPYEVINKILKDGMKVKVVEKKELFERK